uniref:Ribosomal protein L5 n=2 Tax=Laminaria TaxID=33637 RepID=S4S3X0_LAMHY|nr:ribosomal protein L5 [Laminaria digitata]YP_008145577.1 ribosomal protein L5 [Laminaria hyperborea]AEO12911.1 ribosomal protein L5 [Laminaria hyperborea]CAC87957.1 ribosomal protein L5 [Laminaria digitata]
MNTFEKHYYEVVQKDLILSENISTASLLPAPKKVAICLGGESSDENYVVACLGALNIIGGQKPYLIQRPPSQQRNSGSREGVGGKVTLRRAAMYLFFYKLLFHVLPRVRQFEGLRAPAHENIYCFVLKDLFSFEELVPLFPYFEEVGSIQCQFHFTTKDISESHVLGHGLQVCFVSNGKEEKRK